MRIAPFTSPNFNLIEALDATLLFILTGRAVFLLLKLKVVWEMGESSLESNMSNWARMRAERLKRRPPLEGCLKAEAKSTSMKLFRILNN